MKLFNSQKIKTTVTRIYKHFVPSREDTFYLIGSFLIAFFIWYNVTDRRLIEVQYDVRLNYIGQPQHLIVTEGMQSHASVRVRGSAQFFKNLNAGALAYNVDLREIKKGPNVVPINFNEMSEFSSFEIISAQPSRLLVSTENIVEKEVNLDPIIIVSDSSIEASLKERPKLSPEKVTIKGSERLIDAVGTLMVPITLVDVKKEGSYTDSVAIITPQGVEAIPAIVQAAYEIKEITVDVSLTLPITIIGRGDNEKYKLSQDTVDISLRVPRDKVESKSYTDGVLAVITPQENQKHLTQIEFFIPPNTTILKTSIDKVEVEKIK